MMDILNKDCKKAKEYFIKRINNFGFMEYLCKINVSVNLKKVQD